MNRVTETAFLQMSEYIRDRSATDAQLQPPFRDGLEHATAEAEENALRTPSLMVGQLLTTLAASTAASSSSQGAVVISPAAAVVGLHILRGLHEKATLTCIEPEAALQAEAKEAFQLGGFAPARARFLTARPLDVIGRLATDSYQLIYADVAPVELPTFMSAAWPLLTAGGTLVIAHSLLDGTVADPLRRDRDTDAARRADAFLDELTAEHDAVTTRLPLDGGLSLITKRERLTSKAPA